MANYTQQCRGCHINIEGTGDDICYRCLSREHDSILAEVERLRRALDKINAIRNSIVAYQSVGFSQHVYPLVASLEEAGFEGEGYEEAKAKAQTDLQLIASLEADNARLTSEQQHCAKCGGVECHALAGLFCGEHSYEGCREWDGCPICENAKLKSALAASGRGKYEV